MRTVLFDSFGFPIDGYGVSKALAPLVAVGACPLISRRHRSGDASTPAPDMEVLAQDRILDRTDSVPSPSATR